MWAFKLPLVESFLPHTVHLCLALKTDRARVFGPIVWSTLLFRTDRGRVSFVALRVDVFVVVDAGVRLTSAVGFGSTGIDGAGMGSIGIGSAAAATAAIVDNFSSLSSIISGIIVNSAVGLSVIFGVPGDRITAAATCFWFFGLFCNWWSGLTLIFGVDPTLVETGEVVFAAAAADVEATGVAAAVFLFVARLRGTVFFVSFLIRIIFCISSWSTLFVSSSSYGKNSSGSTPTSISVTLFWSIILAL